jgi:hypothetical protein
VVDCAIDMSAGVAAVEVAERVAAISCASLRTH